MAVETAMAGYCEANRMTDCIMTGRNGRAGICYGFV